MNRHQPFSVEDFLEKLASNDPEVALDPTVQAGLARLSKVVNEHGTVSPPRLLLIDDDDYDAEFFQHALRKDGVAIEVTRVRDGREALDYFEGNRSFSDRGRFPLPHLTILDLKLPAIGGLEVLKRMRRLPQCASLAVIVLTSARPCPDMDEFSHLKVSAMISKPNTLAAMIEIIQRVKASWLDGPAPTDNG